MPIARAWCRRERDRDVVVLRLRRDRVDVGQRARADGVGVEHRHLAGAVVEQRRAARVRGDVAGGGRVEDLAGELHGVGREAGVEQVESVVGGDEDVSVVVAGAVDAQEAAELDVTDGVERLAVEHDDASVVGDGDGRRPRDSRSFRWWGCRMPGVRRWRIRRA